MEMQVPTRLVTVRKYYAGTQSWSPRVNGVKYDAHKFMLKVYFSIWRLVELLHRPGQFEIRRFQ